MANNANLASAKEAKNDEFYTQTGDIENELSHYKKEFKNKRIFCNCDDPYESNFFKYFALNFNHLGLKKLIATCYDNSPIAYTQMNFFGENKVFANKNRHPYKIEITKVEDFNNDGAFDLSDVDYLLKNKLNTMTLLKENGDFRSDECVEILKHADIVVTNPPFSLFRQYVAQLIEYDKKFLIIGNQNAITYKEIFSLIKENKIWLGKNHPKEFIQPNGETKKFGLIDWFTNLPTTKRNEFLTLYKKYNEQDYPKYDNYDAINVDKVSDIPYDYDGVMGVPITFLDKYNPEQFEILGITQRNDDPYKIIRYTHDQYKNANDLNARAVIIGKDGTPKPMYARILIRKKTIIKTQSNQYNFNQKEKYK